MGAPILPSVAFSNFVVFVFMALLIRRLTMIIVNLRRRIFVASDSMVRYQFLNGLNFRFSFGIIVGQELRVFIKRSNDQRRPCVIRRIQVLLKSIRKIRASRERADGNAPLLINLYAMDLVGRFRRIKRDHFREAFRHLKRVRTKDNGAR